MNGAITVVLLFLFIVKPCGIARDVTGVRTYGSKSALNCDRQCGIADCSGQPAVADRLKLLVPALCRQPHLNFDVRYGTRLQRRSDSAEGW